MTFLGDEGRDVLVAYNILHGHLTLLGPTASVGGFFFGPVYYYFMAPFLWLFNYDPVGPAVMVALFGIATVWLVYKIGKEFFNVWVGLIAALFYAIAPVIILYSRASWNPNPVPFFTLLTLYTAYKGLEKKKNLWVFASGLLLGIAVELHFIAAIVGVVVAAFFLAVFLLEEKSKKILFLVKRYLWLGFGFFIGWLPYLGFEVRHGFPNTIAIYKFVFESGKVTENSNTFVAIGNAFFRLFARVLTDFPSADLLHNYSSLTINLWVISTILIGLVSIGVFLFQLVQAFKKKEKTLIYLLLLLWLVLGIGIFGFYKKSVYDYYFGFLFALPMFLSANLIVFLFRKDFIWKAVAGVLFIGIFAINIQGIPFRYPGNNQLNQAETIAKIVMDHTGGRPFNFALITGGNSDHAYRYFFTIWGHPPVTIENAQIDPKRMSVTNQLLVVCETLPCQPLGNSLWEIAGFGRAQIAGEWNVSVVQVYKLVHYTGK